MLPTLPRFLSVMALKMPIKGTFKEAFGTKHILPKVRRLCQFRSNKLISPSQVNDRPMLNVTQIWSSFTVLSPRTFLNAFSLFSPLRKVAKLYMLVFFSIWFAISRPQSGITLNSLCQNQWWITNVNWGKHAKRTERKRFSVGMPGHFPSTKLKMTDR